MQMFVMAADAKVRNKKSHQSINLVAFELASARNFTS
jgi:hypothetical protein